MSEIRTSIRAARTHVAVRCAIDDDACWGMGDMGGGDGYGGNKRGDWDCSSSCILSHCSQQANLKKYKKDVKLVMLLTGR